MDALSPQKAKRLARCYLGLHIPRAEAESCRCAIFVCCLCFRQIQSNQSKMWIYQGYWGTQIGCGNKDYHMLTRHNAYTQFEFFSVKRLKCETDLSQYDNYKISQKQKPGNVLFPAHLRLSLLVKAEVACPLLKLPSLCKFCFPL